jgi:hypothetical protein
MCFLCGPCQDVIIMTIGATRLEAGSNTSTVTLRVVGGDENGSLKSETVKYGRKTLLTGPEKDCAGKDQQHMQKIDPSSRERGRPTETRPQLLNSNKYLVMSPRWGSTPRLTDWLTDRQSQCDFDYDLDNESLEFCKGDWEEMVL